MSTTVDREPGAEPDVLVAPPPDLTSDEALDLAERIFGVTGDVIPLDGERDQNFRVTGPSGSFVLKVSNTGEDPAAVDMQTRALAHLAAVDPELPVPRVRPTLAGEAFTRADGHVVHLVTWIDGEMLEPGRLGRGGLEAFGALAGRTARALRGFFHPAAGRTLLWDLKQTPGVRPFLGHLEGERAALVESVFDRFDEHVAAALPSLRAQVVHADLTLTNVVFDAERRPSGVIDFGDLVHTPLVCDLAVTLASVMRGGDETWADAAAMLRGYRRHVELDGAEVDVVGDLVAARLAAGVVISAWRAARFPENTEYITCLDDDSWAALELFGRLGRDEVAQRFRAAAEGALPTRATEELVERRRRLLGAAHAPLSYDRPLHVVRADGVWMYDAEGGRYLDAYNNVPVVGHSHPRVAEAIARQARLLNTNSRYLHETALELAERLLASLPAEIDTCLFVNSGSEANELAWRLATEATGASGGIVSAWAYHGVTATLTDLSPSEWAEGEHPEYVATIAAPAGSVPDAVAELDARGHRPAALLVDSAWTSDGIFTDAPEHVARAAADVRAAGGVFVADEVQAGFGRLGSHLWSFERSDLVPDVVTLGKPMGNGHPVAAVLARSEIAEAFAKRRKPMFSTFGANPVASAAGLAVLDVIEEEGLVERAASVGAYLHAALRELGERHAAVREVRGAGLLAGVQLTGPADAVANAVRERGILIGTTGPADDVLKIRPPLPFEREHVDLLVTALDEALAARAA